MRDSREIIHVRVEALKREHLKPYIVNLDPVIMKKMNLEKGNFISLIGEKETVAIVHECKSKDKDLGIIRINPLIRSNLGKKIGDKIEIEKTKICPAEQVDLIRIDNELTPLIWSNNNSYEINQIRKRLANLYPFTLNDKILSGGLYIVASLIPNDICFVDSNTIITILDESIEGFDEIAIDLFKKILYLDPNDKKVLSALGSAYIRRKSYVRAEEFYLKLSQLFPKDWQFWALLGYIYTLKEEYDKAIEVLETATKFIPSVFPELILYKRKEKAKLTEYSNKFQIPHWLGCAFMRKENYEDALHYFNIVLEINPCYKSTWNHIGKIYHIKGEYHKAIDALNNSLNVPLEKIIEPFFGTLKIFERIEYNHEEFIQSYQYLKVKKEFNELNFEACHNLSKVYLDLNEIDNALHACEESLKIEPKSEDAQTLKEKILKLQKDN